MAARTASRGTRSSGLEEVPSKAPGSKSATPDDGMSWRPFSTIYMFFRAKISCRVQACRRGSSRAGAPLLRTK